MNVEKYKFNAVPFFQEVYRMAGFCLGKEMKKHLVKGKLVEEVEVQLKDCFSKPHQKLYGNEFLKRWMHTYLAYYRATIYEAALSATKNHDLAKTYSDAFYGEFLTAYATVSY